LVRQAVARFTLAPRAGFHQARPGFPAPKYRRAFSPRYAERTMRRMTFAFRVFGMSVTNTISFGASALPRSWATLAFNSAASAPSPFVSYRAGKHGFGNGRCGKCAQSDCVAAAAVSVSALRRELSRPHQHRLRDPRDERR